MVLEKGEPALAGVSRRAPLRQVAGTVDSEISKPNCKSVDPGSSPGRILCRHGSDAIAKRGGDFRSTRTTARKEAPVPPEPHAMPADDGLRLHDHQHPCLFWPPTPEAQPEETIAKAQPGSRILTLEDADLLPQGDELQSEVMPRAEEGTQPRKKSQEEPDHGPSLHDLVDRRLGSSEWLIC